MFKPFTLFIGLRYTRAKRRNHFISFIGVISIVGIALGVGVLITVLSVLNGFDKEWRERILGMMPNISVHGYSTPVLDWRILRKDVLALDIPEITQIEPVIEGQGLLNRDGYSHFSYFRSLLPEEKLYPKDLTQKMLTGKIENLRAGEFGIILGFTLAANIGAEVGDKVTLVLPEASVSPAGVLPRVKRFTVVGTFKTDYEYDKTMAFIHFKDGQVLMRLHDNQAQGLTITVDNLFNAPRIGRILADDLQHSVIVTDWTQVNGSFFKAVKLEKTLMFIMLILIVAVAAFNILSTLVMVVNEKQSDIAILRTLGASPREIMSIFIIQGCVIGIFGTLLGLCGGVALAKNITNIVAWIERTLHITLFQADVYYISFLPSEMRWSDVGQICGVAMFLTLAATLYPAWRGATTAPAEALRYE